MCAPRWRVIDPLEPRLLLCSDHWFEDLPAEIGSFPAIDPSLAIDSDAGVSVDTGSSGATATSPLTSLPQLNSNPGAFAKLFLDFNGDLTPTWGTYLPGTTPAYDQDGDPSTFSNGELDSIREIWGRVAEKYSPFNINVTTVDPGNLNDNETVKVVIGGGPAPGTATTVARHTLAPLIARS